MTKEQFNHETEIISVISDWSITKIAAQVALCMRYIESLEAEITQLQVDNRSLVEQMNQMVHIGTN